MAYQDPETAARESIPPEFARTLAVALAPGGDYTVVLLGTNEPRDLYPYQVICRRGRDGWEEEASSNGPGWTTVSGNVGLRRTGVRPRKARGTSLRTSMPLIDRPDSILTIVDAQPGFFDARGEQHRRGLARMTGAGVEYNHFKGFIFEWLHTVSHGSRMFDTAVERFGRTAA